jgi:HSP20 family protein
MALSLYDNFFDVDDLFGRALKRMGDDISTPLFYRWLNNPFTCINNNNMPRIHPMDILDYDTHFEINVDVPGMTKDNIAVELDNDIIRISGKRESNDKNGGGNNRIERNSYSSFTRSFKLPSNANKAEVSARVENGVLSVSVPKLQPPPPKEMTRIPVL